LTPWWLWFGLSGGLIVLLLLDVFVFHRRPNAVHVRQAVAWSAIWLALGLGFVFVVWSVNGSSAAREYLAGYLIERTLSLDNLFVLAVILGYFAVPSVYRHRALLWGIMGALAFRTLFILVGGVALERLSWLAYVLGAFLILTGIRVARREIEVKPERNRIVALIRRFLPMTERFHGQRLFVRVERRVFATPMVAVFAAIATTDVAFAADSIPAIYAVTDDPFLVFAANAFSVLGMLALYFVLAEIMIRFRYLRPALAVILVFVGLKMALANLYHLPISLSLVVIVGVISIAITASLLHPEQVPAVDRRPLSNNVPADHPEKVADDSHAQPCPEGSRYFSAVATGTSLTPDSGHTRYHEARSGGEYPRGMRPSARPRARMRAASGRERPSGASTQ
jgi:tellurite resistance protein TerC